MSQPDVTICTVVMNRLNHIMQTLPLNLANNPERNVQFLVLDYGSTDGLGSYIKTNYSQELKQGKLVYWRYKAATSFHHSHARNLAFKLATGSILCNNDADNFTGKGFASFVLENMKKEQNICLTGVRNCWSPDASGRLCISRSNFYSVTGYDESFDGYGFEDFDIVNRLVLSGCKAYTINKREFLQSVSHTHDERIQNQRCSVLLKDLFVRFIDENSSELLFFFKDNTYALGKVINTYTLQSEHPEAPPLDIKSVNYQFEVENGWSVGRWNQAGEQLTFQDKTQFIIHAEGNGRVLESSTGQTFKSVSSKTLQLEAVSFFNQSRNRSKLDYNIRNHMVRVNKTFGTGTVSRFEVH